MEPVTVLFADDDEECRELVRKLLSQKDIQVVGVSNGKEALDAWTRQIYNLIILDVMMPVMDGLETLRRIRLVSDISVILLTAKEREKDIMDGFASGASDYVFKPFRPPELLARVLNRLGSDQGTSPLAKLKYGDIIMDLKRRHVTCKDKSIDLSQLEFNLLLFLMKHPGEVVSKQDLLRFVWGYQSPQYDLNLVEAVVVRLRKKIKTGPDCPVLIHTVRSAGYRFGLEE